MTKELRNVEFLVVVQGKKYLTDSSKWSTDFRKAKVFEDGKEVESFLSLSSLRKYKVKAVVGTHTITDNRYVEYHQTIENYE